MPGPLYNEGEGDHSNRLIHDELRYNRRSMLEEHQQLLRNLTAEQKSVYEKIMAAVDEAKDGLLFLYGYGGIGKTFIWKTLSSDSTCNIKQGSPLAKLIVKAKLIIWDEAPMMHRYCFEALDQTLRDILIFKDTSSLDRPFGGKTVVLGSDFRQILPVITKGNQLGPHLDELKEFSDWILAIGDGRIGSSVDGIEKVRIPDDLLIHNCDDTISAIVESTYPDFFKHSNDIDYLQQRAILAPTLDMVESINDYIVSLNHNPEKTYLSSDTICMSDHAFTALDHVHTPEFLNNIKCSGVPNHSMTLKVGVHLMLLRNIDQSSGLCNGTRLIITRLGNRVIEAKDLSGNMAGEKVFIPRMTLTPSDARIPFKFQRRQFSIVVSFAMTINKSQGQSLSHVGLFLKKSVFTHGQLYVALSRVTSRKGLKILVYDDDGQKTNEARNRFITTKSDKLAQGVTGLIQSHISPPSFLWLNPQSSKLFDVELISQSFIPRDFGITVDNTVISEFSAIFDIGNRS
uniref:ATP-dependent DNA helicase n=1 Tax=Nicotiana sylvestris TaxID=4096 RepID=A0A1U7Y5Y8_NICSY|nr:PREDICTED: ATP-dependent DNA helicase PIF1-like [Nicotiana sylvestris]